MISQLAIAKTGAAWLPFDGDAPVERIAVVSGKDCTARRLLLSDLEPISSPNLAGAIALPGGRLTTDHLTDVNWIIMRG